MVPASDTDRRVQPSTIYDLLAADLTICFALLPGSCLPLVFVVTNVEQAILGIHFLSIHEFLVDSRHRCHLHQPPATIIHAEPFLQPKALLTILCQATQFQALLQEFPLLTSL